MPAAPSAIPAASRRHQWHMLVDRVRCRTCDVLFTLDGDDKPCKGARKVRPMATFRQQQQQEGRA